MYARASATRLPGGLRAPRQIDTALATPYGTSSVWALTYVPFSFHIALLALRCKSGPAGVATMFRLRPLLARRPPLPHSGPRLSRAALWSRRTFSNSPRRADWEAGPQQQQLPRVLVIRPVLWALTAVGVIYLGCAAGEVVRDVRSSADTRRGWRFQRSKSSYEDLDSAQRQGRTPSTHAPHGVFDGSGSPLGLWRSLPEAEKLLLANIALNTSLYFTRTATTEYHLVHVPMFNRNYTMFTSMFAHSSMLHLLVNMYCLYNFAQPVAYSPTFGGSGSHLAAFYLSAGVLSCLGQQLEAAIPSRRFIGGVGASGAIMAMIGAYGMSNPDQRIGMLFIPGSIPAGTALGYMAAFETVGLLFRFSFLPLAHSVHLAGLAFGAGYIHFDGKKRVWEPTKKFAFGLMRRLGLV